MRFGFQNYSTSNRSSMVALISWLPRSAYISQVQSIIFMTFGLAFDYLAVRAARATRYHIYRLIVLPLLRLIRIFLPGCGTVSPKLITRLPTKSPECRSVWIENSIAVLWDLEFLPSCPETLSGLLQIRVQARNSYSSRRRPKWRQILSVFNAVFQGFYGANLIAKHATVDSAFQNISN